MLFMLYICIFHVVSAYDAYSWAQPDRASAQRRVAISLMVAPAVEGLREPKKVLAHPKSSMADCWVLGLALALPIGTKSCSSTTKGMVLAGQIRGHQGRQATTHNQSPRSSCSVPSTDQDPELVGLSLACNTPRPVCCSWSESKSQGHPSCRCQSQLGQ